MPPIAVPDADAQAHSGRLRALGHTFPQRTRLLGDLPAIRCRALLQGIEFLRPLTLREVAEVINMHESTVSRVTNEKYVQTPRGVLPLDGFRASRSLAHLHRVDR